MVRYTDEARGGPPVVHVYVLTLHGKGLHFLHRARGIKVHWRGGMRTACEVTLSGRHGSSGGSSWGSTRWWAGEVTPWSGYVQEPGVTREEVDMQDGSEWHWT